MGAFSPLGRGADSELATTTTVVAGSAGGSVLGVSLLLVSALGRSLELPPAATLAADSAEAPWLRALAASPADLASLATTTLAVWVLPVSGSVPITTVDTLGSSFFSFFLLLSPSSFLAPSVIFFRPLGFSSDFFSSGSCTGGESLGEARVGWGAGESVGVF